MNDSEAESITCPGCDSEPEFVPPDGKALCETYECRVILYEVER
ncbi:MAG: hypothetical protein ABEJ68_07625 [Halobacteriaceae archaeon]